MTDCDLCVNGKCTKWKSKAPCKPSDIDWFDSESTCFMAVDEVCRWSSIFGNEYVGLTREDIDRLMKGEIIRINVEEYNAFIGFVGESKGDKNDQL